LKTGDTMLTKNCTKRKHEYRTHELLSNKQWLNLYFFKKRYYGVSAWFICCGISKTTRESNDWYCGGKVGSLDGKQTGKCGIEGLRKALQYILEFEKKLKPDEILFIDTAIDKKRMNAYSWLIKHCDWRHAVDTKTGEYTAFFNRLPSKWYDGMLI
jgi:hypothetical protein